MQLTKLTKKSFKGFTLIELLVVIAIIGLLSTIVAAPVQSARKKAKDTKKVAEIKQLQTALSNYANDNGEFPHASTSPGLAVLTPSYMPALPKSLDSTNARDKTYYVSYIGYPVGSLTPKVFGYHLGATLEIYNTVLADDADCWGVVSTSSAGQAGNKNGGPCLTFVSAQVGATTSAQYEGYSAAPITGDPNGTTITGINGITATGTGATTFAFEQYKWVNHPLSKLSATADFQGLGLNEGASSTCGTIDQCIYDVTDSY